MATTFGESPLPLRDASPPAPIVAVVPNRVDLAGGTLDIFPLYLLVDGALTVNAAIGLTSRAEIRPVPGPARLVSENFALRTEAPDTHGFPAKGRFGLVASALHCFPPRSGIEIRFRNEAPIGSGVGASSALLVAAMLAMDALAGRRRGWRETARQAMEVEALHLRSLAGRQDHVAALRGGIQAIRFLPGAVEAKRVSPGSTAGRRLAAHGFLAGTGKSHFSAGMNWRMIRGAIEGERAVLRKFERIARAARDAWQAVSAGEMERLGLAVAREWEVRKTLSRGISTGAVEEAARSRCFRRLVAGAKLCGAGGGGMLFGILRRPDGREEVESFLRRRGFEVYPFRLSAGPAVTGGRHAS